MTCLCLTLHEQPERGQRAKDHFEQHGLNVAFVHGVNGLLSGLVSSHPYEIDHPGTNYHIGPATIGIFLSHLMAWSIVCHQDSEHVLILEDDVILCDDFKAKMNQALLDASDCWDILFLGSCCTQGHEKKHIAGNVYEVSRAQCLHAYIVNKRAAETLIVNLRDVFGPVDCLMALNNFFGLKVYAVLPRLAEQIETELPE